MKPSSQPIRVMIVDDHQTMLWGLDKLISGATPAMEVVATAASCNEALVKLGRVEVDVVLLDLDLDGESALDILPTLVTLSRARVLVLTGEREQSKLDLAVFRGARGILRKDASAAQVLKAIEKTHEGELWLDRGSLGRVFSEFLSPSQPKVLNPELQKQALLTSRERKIIETVVEGSGASNKALAAALFNSEHTLRNHLTSIYQKLGVNNRLELYVYAIRHQLGNAQANSQRVSTHTPAHKPTQTPIHTPSLVPFVAAARRAPRGTRPE